MKSMSDKVVLLSVGLIAQLAMADQLPLYSLRFSNTQTLPERWKETCEVLKRYPGMVDEVWFSTGISYPSLDWHRTNAAQHASAAADLRKLGITPSLQVQVTLGHGIVGKNKDMWIAKNWSGFVGCQGGECICAACPTDERFIKYIVESTALYATYKPAWVWIDDDFRAIGHGPEASWKYNEDLRDYGCWCDRCLKLFAEREGKSYTRKELYEAMGKDAALADRWDEFSHSTLAKLAERIAARFHELSPTSRFGLQHCPHISHHQDQIFKALYRATGNQGVGSRPGGGWYQDHTLYSTILKAYFEVKQKTILGNPPEIELYTPEIETYPRVFTSRAGRSIPLESLAALTMGLDTLSIYIFDSVEPTSYYERRFMGPLAKAEKMLRHYREVTRETLPSGLKPSKHYPNFKGFECTVPNYWQVTTGIPVVMGPAHELGEIDIDSISAWAASTKRLLTDYERADKIAGGRLAVIPAQPLHGWLMPRTLSDGTLKAVTFVNTTLDPSWPTKLKLRGVPASVSEATWYDLDGTTKCCVLTREGADAFVILPEVAPWNGGYLAFDSALSSLRPLSESLRQWKMPYKLGVARYTMHKHSLDDTLLMMQDMDCHYLGLKEGTISYGASDEEIAAYKRKCAAYGVEVVSAGPLYFETEDQLANLMQFAKRYGMHYVSVVPRELNPEWKEGMPVSQKWLESDKMMDVLEKYVRQYDISAAIHNHGPDNAYLYPTAEAALKRIGKRDRRIGVCLDVGHERRAGLSPVDFIQKHGDRIYEVHLKNIKIDPVANYAKEGPRGELDIPAILRALSDIGFSGYCLIEYEKDFSQNAVPLAESLGYYRGVCDTLPPKTILKPVPEGANRLTDAERDEGYELLFNGKDLPTDKWVGIKSGCQTFPQVGWFVKDGALTMRPRLAILENGTWVDLPPEDVKLAGGGDIATIKKYRDFIFKFDFRTTRKANSGVKYFFDERLNSCSSEEYQILEPGHPDAVKGKDGNRRVASLYDIYPAPAADKCVRGPGEWNSGMIVAKGNHVEHWLNGVKVLEYERGSEAFRQAVAASKYVNWGKDAAGNAQLWGEIGAGRVLLQDHNDSTVSFCNLKIREL